ncbi:MAG TPA: hypothetical protein VGO93_21800 [Candidatus Xenobia bacterium]|jgi:hypothetical protein
MLTDLQQPVNGWPGQADLDAWGSALERTPRPAGLWTVTTGRGSKRALLVAYPAGHQPVGAAALAAVWPQLSEDDRYTWDVLPYTAPSDMALNQEALAVQPDPVLTATHLYRSARSGRFDRQGWNRYDLCVVLRERFAGPAFVATSRDAGPLLNILKSEGLPVGPGPVPELEPGLGTSWVSLFLPRFICTDATQTTAAEAVARFAGWYESARPYLDFRSPARAALDEWLAEQTGGPDTRVHVEAEHLLAAAHLLRLVRAEMAAGHTVPALMASVRPLQCHVQSGLSVEVEPMTPARAAAVVSQVLRGV